MNAADSHWPVSWVVLGIVFITVGEYISRDSGWIGKAKGSLLVFYSERYFSAVDLLDPIGIYM